MAESVGWSTLDVIPSMKGFRSALDKGTMRDFAAVGRSGGARLGDEAGKAASGRLKARLGGTIRDMFAPAAGVLAGAGIVAGLKTVITEASAAQQSVGGVQAVFGRYADDVIKKSQEAAQALGLSTTAYQELATVSAALLKNKGISDYTEQAQKLLQVGADLAAQYGGSTKDAVDALNAAMRGETDPIERYGVSLNQAAVNAELAKQGLSKLRGAAQQQAQTQARLSIITQQTADAQGAFARESDTLAGAQQRAQAQLANMRAELGAKFLPVLTTTVGFINDKALPTLADAGGVATDTARAFGRLPAPVKAAAGALVAFRAAQALGITGSTARGLTTLRDGLDGVRLRAMLAADEYRNLRTASLTFTNGAPQFTAASGRMTSSLGALRAAASGAGGALRRGLAGALNVVGGPWGAGLAVGTALLVNRMHKQQQLNAATKEFTALLDEQTGALTKGNRDLAARELIENGATERARKLGISLRDLQEAALGNDEALRRVAAAAKDFGGEGVILLGNLKDVRDVVQSGKDAWRDQADLLGKSGEATKKIAATTRDYRGELDKLRDAVQGVIDKENERRGVNLSAFDAQTRLAAAYRDAMKEAREGARTLDQNTEAGEANRDALSALAKEWNDAPGRIRGARGAYEDMRQKFIQVADQMGASAEEARHMADRLLAIPKNVAPKFSTPGLEQARGKVKQLQEELTRAQDLATIRLRVIGPGDISRPEFGHGVGQQPYATPQTAPRTAPMFHIDKVVAQDYQDFTNQMKRRQRSAQLDGWLG